MAEGERRHLQCVIPCGGSSVRLGLGCNKCLVEVAGEPILGHIVSYWQDRGIENFIFIIGGETASSVGEYVWTLQCNAIVIDRGNTTNLVKAIELAEPYIRGRFILALGDCLNFGDFVGDYPPFGVGVCIANPYELSKSYLVQLDGQSVSRLVEKPKSRLGLCGMGTLFLDKRFFDYTKRLKLPDEATSVDLTGALQLAIGQGEVIKPVFFKGDYVNITYPADLATAESLARIYNNHKIVGKELCC